MLTPRTADYLETIYLLSLENDTVGVSQVAAAREVTIPTARSAISKLKDAGYVRQERYGKILLTEAGRKHAASVYRTHSVLFRFLCDVLGVDAESADSEACQLEHGLSQDTLSRLVKFLDGQAGAGAVGANGVQAGGAQRHNEAGQGREHRTSRNGSR